jgi:hypothetical protein
MSDREPREMHSAVCSDCGNECQVPFKPDPADQSIVEIVGQREDGHVVSVTRRLRERTVLTIFLLFPYF